MSNSQRINHLHFHSCQKSSNFSISPTYLCLQLSDHVLAGLSFATTSPTIDNQASARFLLTNHVLGFRFRRLMLDCPLSNRAGAWLLTNHVTVVNFWPLKFERTVKYAKQIDCWLCSHGAKNKIFFVSPYPTDPLKMAPTQKLFSWFENVFFFSFTKIYNLQLRVFCTIWFFKGISIVKF